LAKKEYNGRTFMKNVFLFLFCLTLGCLIVYEYRKYTYYQKTSELKTPVSKTLPFSIATPPKYSLKGNIVSFTDSVRIQSREATQESRLTTTTPVLQGEDFWTEETGNIQIQFPENVDITVLPNTHIGIVQTLPNKFVFLQDSGEVTYKNRQDSPLAIRVLRLLIAQKKGEIYIAIDEAGAVITVTVNEGSVDIGFNDTDIVSNVIHVADGFSYVFDTEIKKGEIVPTND